jgi:outer membrane protein TolC
VARALDKNEDLIVERESLAAAEAAVEGSRGAYDPLLGLDAGWRRASEPVSSAFSGAPPGELGPTLETAEAGASLSRLLPSGGAVSLRADTARGTSDSAFDLLSPVYDNRPACGPS